MNEGIDTAGRPDRALRAGFVVFCVVGSIGAVFTPLLVVMTVGGRIRGPHENYPFLLWPPMAVDHVVRQFAETREWGLLWLLVAAFFSYGLLGWLLWRLGRSAWHLANRFRQP